MRVMAAFCSGDGPPPQPWETSSPIAHTANSSVSRQGWVLHMERAEITNGRLGNSQEIKTTWPILIAANADCADEHRPGGMRGTRANPGGGGATARPNSLKTLV